MSNIDYSRDKSRLNNITLDSFNLKYMEKNTIRKRINELLSNNFIKKLCQKVNTRLKSIEIYNKFKRNSRNVDLKIANKKMILPVLTNYTKSFYISERPQERSNSKKVFDTKSNNKLLGLITKENSKKHKTISQNKFEMAEEYNDKVSTLRKFSIKRSHLRKLYRGSKRYPRVDVKYRNLYKQKHSSLAMTGMSLEDKIGSIHKLMVLLMNICRINL